MVMRGFKRDFQRWSRIERTVFLTVMIVGLLSIPAAMALNLQ
jgi:hypothetical protein